MEVVKVAFTVIVKYSKADTSLANLVTIVDTSMTDEVDQLYEECKDDQNYQKVSYTKIFLGASINDITYEWFLK